MTHILSIDPGKNSGIALGYYDAITPYRLLERWQVHSGTEGFIRWFEDEMPRSVDELVVEKFVLDGQNQFTADLAPKEIEGVLKYVSANEGIPIIWQPRTDKAALIGYRPEQITKAQRQRARFDFLKRFGMFRPGTEFDDSNDAIVHALVSLKRRKHGPTLMAMWPPTAVN